MVAGEFNGASWRRDQQFDSTLDEAFKNVKLPVPPWLGPEEFQANGLTCADLSSR